MMKSQYCLRISNFDEDTLEALDWDSKSVLEMFENPF